METVPPILARCALVGRTINQYEITAKLGEGGMGAVYQATDARLRRKVALKILPQEFVQDRQRMTRFQREAEVLASLNHPNISIIHGLEESGEIRALVLELVEGPTLEERLAQERISVEEALQITLQVAQALETTHAKGIIHRDLKPSNIKITAEGTVKVLDFGLAKQVADAEKDAEEARTNLTRDGSTLGTLAYMSPEQLRGQRVDARSDIFSLGVVLYEMLAGVHPFRQDSSMDTAHAILHKTPRPLGRYSPGVSRQIQNLVGKMIEKEPARRYQAIDETLVDLRTVLNDKRPLGRTVGRGVSRWVWPMLGASLLLLGLLWRFGVFDRSVPEGGAETPRPESTRVAVLPFENMSPDSANEYFSDGITHDTSYQLSKIEQLAVISRTSVMRYKNSNKSIREIGEELKVQAVLEGSVRREGERVRIIAQLIDVETEEQLWEQSYEQEVKDIFAIQSGIARQIASALKTELLPKKSHGSKKILPGTWTRITRT